MVAAVVEPERLVFVDECGTHTSLASIYGYAPKGERLYLPVPRTQEKNTTVLSSMSVWGDGSYSRGGRGDHGPGLRDLLVEMVLAF